jgi:mRNA-degrading endonuclease RelE of RelBE toxin-antitoxin system
VTCQVYLSEKAQRDLDRFSDKIAKQILTDCIRLSDDPIPDGKRIKKLQGFKESVYRLRAGDYRVVFTRSGPRIDIVRILSKPDFQKPTESTWTHRS